MCACAALQLGVPSRAHEQNAMKVARLLHGHPKVERVMYPGCKRYLCV